MTWVASGIAVGSQLLGGANSASAARKKDRKSAEGIRAQRGAQQQATTRLGRTFDMIGSSDPNVGGVTSQFINELRARQAPRSVALPSSSARFRGDLRASNKAATTYGNDMAGAFARVAAPGRQRQAENIEIGRAGGDISTIQNIAQGSDYLNKMESEGIQQDPWVDLLAGMGSNLASGMAGAHKPVKTGAPTGAGGFNVVTGQARIPQTGWDTVLPKTKIPYGTPPFAPPK